MDMKIQRSLYRSDGIFGVMTDINDVQVAVTLEHAFRQDDGSFKPAVPAGTYTCVRYMSPKFGREVFMLQNVPGHDAEEIHFGNWNKDSIGCTLVGRRVIQDPDDENTLMITSSQNTFNKFMDIQKELDSFQLTVEDEIA